MREGRAIGIAAWLAVCAWTTGCDEGGGSITLDEYGAESAEATCATIERCYGPDLVEALAGPDCVGSAQRTLEQASLPQIEAAIAAGTVQYDGAAARECVDAVADASCAAIDRASLPACEDAFVGTVAAGGACALDEECAGDAFCRIELTCPGTCQARVPSGSACEGDDECQAALRCLGGTCQAPAREGAACGGGTEIECAAGLVCLGQQEPSATMPEGRTGLCRSLPATQTAAIGATCDPDNGPLCVSGVSCALIGVTAGTTPVFECVAASTSGGACNLGFPDPCPFDHTCEGVDLAMGDFEGTCVALPRAGEPCPNNRCGRDAWCSSGTCRAVQSIGSACTSDADCFSGFCDGGTCAEGVLCTER
ncbi:hypothetical protein [Sandaracinus amylolyticus]|uniref:hypothetical protein n=1 Tax=Sandaracinus amylolyticus TaxID=927083 RepID=UPI001F34C63A|nr:hypothetical protein [Sandaracinus amylolyticus]UJR80023.1 Tryptophan synthase alpha chain [Sandaracinus amylolyticus]